MDCPHWLLRVTASLLIDIATIKLMDYGRSDFSIAQEFDARFARCQSFVLTVNINSDRINSSSEKKRDRYA
jgi:hypothetical protein